MSKNKIMSKTVLVLGLTFVSLSLACVRNYVPPEEAAAKFATDLGIRIQGKPVCAGVDSDGDGYVTCTLALAPPEPGQQPKTWSIQCAGVTKPFFSTGDDGQTDRYVVGCKETQPKVVVPGAK